MAKIFYDHLIIIEEIVAVLDEHNISPEEKKKLLAVIDQTLHHHILDTILTILPKEHHETFLTKFTHHPYDPGILTFLQENTSKDVEKELLKTIQTVKQNLHKEIKNSFVP